mmetsp:Transcript_26904/g.74151  ORF Transcript_26904/g.74151 Transcript_26904/m.74151 type:complete len:437 (+) Transcript_26904:149-1459(+)
MEQWQSANGGNDAKRRNLLYSEWTMSGNKRKRDDMDNTTRRRSSHSFPPPLVNENGQIGFLHNLLTGNGNSSSNNNNNGGEPQQLANHPPHSDDDRLCTLVSAYSTQYPQVVSWSDVFGRTPLFWACKNSNSVPTSVIRLLLVANPPAMCQPDFSGRTPLGMLYHSSKAASVLSMVLEQDPSLAMTRSIHFHCATTRDGTILVDSRYDALSKIPLLLQLCESAPLKRLFASSKSFDDSAAAPLPTATTISTQSKKMDRDDEATLLWSKLLITLRAAYCHEFDHSISLGATAKVVPELHMALRLKLPALVIFHLCRRYPEQISIPMSSTGRRDQGAAYSSTMIRPLHFVLTHCAFAQSPRVANLIQIMTSHYPQALAEQIRIGNLHNNRMLPGGVWPLHQALKSGFTWYTGIRHMVAMMPEILLYSTLRGLKIIKSL